MGRGRFGRHRRSAGVLDPTALKKRERLLRPLGGVLMFTSDEDMPPVDAVGEAGTASLQELEPLLEHATELLGIEAHRAQGLIGRVRRFPAPEAPGRERFGEANANPLSHVDRIEAIDAVYELFSVPRARSLITDARRLLGHVLRDAGLLHDLLDELGARSGSPRGALIVALGMLGERVAFERAVPVHSDADAVAAWILAAVLADWMSAEEALDANRQVVTGPARRLLETALRRLRGGYFVSAIG